MKSSTSLTLADEDILNAISEHTTELKRALWLRQIRYNQQHYGFGRSPEPEKLHKEFEGRKAVVIAAGPGFRRLGMADLEKVAASKPVIVSCDGALPTLASLGIKPTFVVSVDAHPVVANFYRRSKNILEGTDVVLSTTINRDVVEECLAAGAKVSWIQGFFKGDANHSRFYQEKVTSVNTGGNVGTTCYMLAAFGLGCRPIGLMGLEFAWSDETPYNETQYYEELQRIVGEENVPQFYRRVKNHRDGGTYIADPVYYSYLLMFREIWGLLPDEVRKATYNLTKQGILTAPGLKYVSAEEFVAL